MKGKVVDNIVSSKSLFSVLIDESTSLSQSSCLIVYICTTFDNHMGPVTFVQIL